MLSICMLLYLALLGLFFLTCMKRKRKDPVFNYLDFADSRETPSGTDVDTFFSSWLARQQNRLRFGIVAVT
ncbi:hypothetical protein F4809DRAFT_624323 [Biscogniauxia mediterranea]|nr:hypothetical protein F4809DRAFT_624323 [Biscogniauxia mediterranea]